MKNEMLVGMSHPNYFILLLTIGAYVLRESYTYSLHTLLNQQKEEKKG
jgi:hypothetical protein